VGYTGSQGYTGSFGLGLTTDQTSTVTLSTGFKFIPETDGLQDLGSPTNRFGKLYVAGQTIDIGGTTLSVDPNGGGLIIQTSTGTAETLSVGKISLGDSLALESTGTLVKISATGTSLIIDADIVDLRGLVTTATITATNILVSGITSATSTSSGALQVVGGVGIGGDLYVGGTIVSKRLVIEYTTVTTTSVTTDDVFTTTNDTNSTGTNTGALVIAGGAGIGKDVNIGGKLYVNGQTVSLAETESTGTTSGALVISGGVGIAKDVYVGGKLYVQGQSIDLNGAEISSDGTSVTFPNVTLAANGVLTFANGTVQKSKAPQMYTNADAAAGLTIDDMIPGDFYYDDVTESIFIMVDTGLGYNNLLDLTVRAA
jgi:hypothetical protein